MASEEAAAVARVCKEQASKWEEDLDRPIPAFMQDKRQPQPYDHLREAFHRLITDAEGSEAHRAGLVDTPRRATAAWRELTSGYRSELDLTTFENHDHYDEIVAVRSLPFYSLCEHHMLPFHGSAHFAYIPRRRILGLSKFARLLDHFSRRLQVQERMTQQMADALHRALAPEGVLVVVQAEHLCMSMRGVQRPGHTTTTSVVRERMKTDPAARDEAMRLLGL